MLVDRETVEVVRKWIPRGRRFARTKGDIAQCAAIDTRSVELAVNALRREFLPVLSGNEGYWISDDPEECRRCAASLRSRVAEIAETARDIEACAEKLERALAVEAGGQARLFSDREASP